MHKLKYGVFIMSVCFANMANAETGVVSSIQDDVAKNTKDIDSLKNTKADKNYVDNSIQEKTAIISEYESKIRGNADRAEQKAKEAAEHAAKVDEYKQQVNIVDVKASEAKEIAGKADEKADRAVDTATEAKKIAEGAVKESKAYTDAKFKEFDNKIENVKKFAAAGTAAAMAAAQIPQVSQGSAFSLGVGVGNYAGQTALSLGVSARLGDYTITKIAVTSDSMNNTGASMGVAVEW